MRDFLKILVITLLPFAIGIAVNLEDDPEKNESKRVYYPEHIAGAYTGGFGEQSCHSCHFNYELNQPEGELSVSGLQESFRPGREYTFTIRVEREDMNRAGFQMTSRFKDSTQAGSFQLTEHLTTTPNIDSKITYLQHGVGKVDAQNGEKVWEIKWMAPERKEPIVFNIAANAANGDASEFGDWIYLEEITLHPVSGD